MTHLESKSYFFSALTFFCTKIIRETFSFSQSSTICRIDCYRADDDHINLSAQSHPAVASPNLESHKIPAWNFWNVFPVSAAPQTKKIASSNAQLALMSASKSMGWPYSTTPACKKGSTLRACFSYLFIDFQYQEATGLSKYIRTSLSAQLSFGTSRKAACAQGSFFG